MTTFIAVDGESITEHGEHKYTMMRSSNGDAIDDRRGLSTVECLNFLLDVKRPGANVVGFGFNYDVNMILRDMDLQSLQDLWSFGDVRWSGYRLKWIPSKFFSVSKNGRSVVVNDVFGFFQSSFVRALEAWDVPDIGGHIERMKGLRSVFGWGDRDEVSVYCITECHLLVALMQKLETALLASGIKLTRWYGAGCIANHILNKAQVKKLHRHDSEVEFTGKSPLRAVMSGYFGGRIELFKQGIIQDCVTYDIRSAYPAITATLPDLHGKFRHTSTYDPDAEYAVWLVEWDLPSDELLMPFPVRHKMSIYYPCRGSGYYWQDEVREAIAHYPIRVREGWIYEPESPGVYPLADLIGELWRKRAVFRETDPGAYKVVKLGINSLYGKFAQGLSKDKLPRYQSYLWAGLITSGTRATLLRYGLPNKQHLVTFATDSLTFDTNVALPVGDDLGDLERQEWENLFIAQPGVYYGWDEAGNETFRTRGFMSREIDWMDLIEGWKVEGPMYRQERETTRFVGIGGALHRKQLGKWRTWPTEQRVLTLTPSHKTFELPSDMVGSDAGTLQHYPPKQVCPVSEPYKPKGGKIPVNLDYIDELDTPIVLGEGE